MHLSLIFRLTAGFGTLRSPQVAGLHRAVPSTALDKVFNCEGIITVFPLLSRGFIVKIDYAFLIACFIILCYNTEKRKRG